MITVDKPEIILKKANLKTTVQRQTLVSLIFGSGHRHVTAQSLQEELLCQGHKISLATIYNTLNHLKEAELLKEVIVDQNQSFFDTNTEDHFHIYDVRKKHLSDIPEQAMVLDNLILPANKKIKKVDVIIHIDE